MPDGLKGWAQIGLEVVQRIRRYPGHRPEEGGRSAFIPFDRLRETDNKQPTEEPAWWWIYTPFLLKLLSDADGKPSPAVWATLGRNVDGSGEEWLNFESQGMDEAATKRFRTVASLLAHPVARELARPRITLLTFVLHKLMELGGDTPPIAIHVSFDGEERNGTHSAIQWRKLPQRQQQAGVVFRAEVRLDSSEPVELSKDEVQTYLTELGVSPEVIEDSYIEIARRAGVEATQLVAWNRWVHDLSPESPPWNRILAISENPQYGGIGRHPAALVVYLRKDYAALGPDEVESFVLAFYAGALANYKDLSLAMTTSDLRDHFGDQFHKDASRYLHDGHDSHRAPENSGSEFSGDRLLAWLRRNIPAFSVTNPVTWDEENRWNYPNVLYEWMKGGFAEGKPIWLGTLALVAAFAARTEAKPCDPAFEKAGRCHLMSWDRNATPEERWVCLDAFFNFVCRLLKGSNTLTLKMESNSLELCFAPGIRSLESLVGRLRECRKVLGRSVLSGSQLTKENELANSFVTFEWLSRQHVVFGESNARPGFVNVSNTGSVTTVRFHGVQQEL